jgi:hypothetical protein
MFKLLCVKWNLELILHYLNNIICKRKLLKETCLDKNGYSFFIFSLVNIVGATGKGYTVWQEIIDNNVTVKADTVVEVWKV